MQYKRNTKTISTKHPKQAVVLAVLILILLLIAGAILYVRGSENRTKAENTAQTGSQSTKGEAGSSKGAQSSSQADTETTNDTQPGDAKSTIDGTAGALLAPSGNFVSAHHVPGNQQISSVCNTTPGATCKIEFSQGTITKSLPAETADKGGSAYWNAWSPDSIGLSAGTWNIKATSTLNGASQSAVDALPLEVQ